MFDAVWFATLLIPSQYVPLGYRGGMDLLDSVQAAFSKDSPGPKEVAMPWLGFGS